MVKCTFCSKEIHIGTGFVIFKKSGQALNYCSRKCMRNLEMGRNPRNYKWSSPAIATTQKQKQPATV
ncbi:TPA: 50S ribosomal protein L24 [Candidatus Micrarchaeota archaeon]|nr:50S ribosomal protein L24 [Candidatus Micrarchaeota archaeon]